MAQLDSKFLWLSVLAAALYVLNCALLGFSLPGLEFDEAISMRGAMEIAVDRPTTTFFPEQSICFGKHCGRLMVAPYVGAAKDYLLLPLFWLFEPSVAMGRFGAAILVG